MKRVFFSMSVVAIFFACSNNAVKDVATNEELNVLDSIQQVAEDTSINTIDSISNSTENSQRLANFNKDFLAFYQQVVAAIQSKNAAQFNQFIAANFGLYIIENPGAMPVINKVYDVNQFESKPAKKNFFEMEFVDMDKIPIFEVLPQVICAATIYNKQGCFAEKINPLTTSQLWNYANLNEKEIQAIDHLATTVQITVINTSNYTFYFSTIDGKWALTFLDLRTPCES